MTLGADTGARLDRQPDQDRSEDGDRLVGARRREQRADRWCWAASIESARDTLRIIPRRRQHLIAARHLGVDPILCRNFPRHEDCNKPVDRSDLECLWQKEGFGKAEFKDLTISFEDLQREIAADRPVQLEIDNRHVILVVGWRVDELGIEIVEIVDTDGSNPPVEWNLRDLDAYRGFGPWRGTCVSLEFDGSETCHA